MLVLVREEVKVSPRCRKNSFTDRQTSPALKEVEEKEGHSSIQHVLDELAMDSEKIPAEPLKGEWI